MRDYTIFVFPNLPRWIALAAALVAVALALRGLQLGHRARRMFAEASEGYGQTADELADLLDRIGQTVAADEARRRAASHRSAAAAFRRGWFRRPAAAPEGPVLPRQAAQDGSADAGPQERASGAPGGTQGASGPVSEGGAPCR